MTFSNTIAGYALYYYGKRGSDRHSIARISLYNERSINVGVVYFFRDGQPIPNNSSNETRNIRTAALKMHERQLDTVVDMLRNEKPCSISYSSPTWAYIHTGREPVGEEESEA